MTSRTRRAVAAPRRGHEVRNVCGPPVGLKAPGRRNLENIIRAHSQPAAPPCARLARAVRWLGARPGREKRRTKWKIGRKGGVTKGRRGRGDGGEGEDPRGTGGGGTKKLQHASNEREAKQEGRKLSNAYNEHE